MRLWQCCTDLTADSKTFAAWTLVGSWGHSGKLIFRNAIGLRPRTFNGMFEKLMRESGLALNEAGHKPTKDSLVINRWVQHVAGLLWRGDYNYKKAGIVLGDISPVSMAQGDLLEPAVLDLC